MLLFIGASRHISLLRRVRKQELCSSCHCRSYISSSSKPKSNVGVIATTSTNDPTEDDEYARRPTTTKGKLSSYADLSKARLTSLVVATTAAGFVAAGPFALATDPSVLGSVVVGTALCSASASAWNQILEIPRDRKMKRTMNRPLVTGSLTKVQATKAAIVWGVSGTALLWLGTDPVTTALGAGNILLYSGLYTALKPVTTVNTWIGAVVGAIPPVMGYTAATAVGNSTILTTSSSLAMLLDPIALSLGATLYLWQLPHFLALSYMYRSDYTRGGFAMLPCHTITGATSADSAAEHTANVIVRYAWYLAAVPVLSTALNVTSNMYALEGLVLNAYALTVAHRFQRERTNQNARKIFLTSLWYLPCTLMLFLLHSKTWDNQAIDANQNVLTQFLSEQIHAVRSKGRELCIHESATLKGSQECPIVVGKERTLEGIKQAKGSVAEAASINAVDRVAIHPAAAPESKK